MVFSMAGLTDHQRAILDFEREWWRYSGGKAVEIEHQLELTPVAYYRELNELIGSVPGLGRVKRRIEEKQADEDEYRAEEEPATAPDRRSS